MTLQEALSQGLMTTVIGLIIVFGVLFILMLVLMLMKKIFYKNTQEVQTATPVQELKELVPEKPVREEPAKDENELIAVLTAAVAASLNTSTYKLNIKSYKRVNNDTPAWNKMGINDVINSRN